MEDKRLAEVIDYETHIAPYRIVEIVAGMGAGKNYWVENVLMGEQRVLLITSRKAKVEETQSRTGLGSCLNLSKRRVDNLIYQLNHNKKRGSCVCNNWQIEHYMKNEFVPEESKMYLWDFFDIIVVDEAHSLATDAIYADAPFFLLDFIRAVYKNSDIPIVLMTATPAPIDGLIRPKQPEKYKVWDFTKECICINPDRIWHQTRQQSLEQMVYAYNHTNRESFPKSKVVYFSTKIDIISQKLIPFLIGSGIPEEVIAVSFSKDESKAKFSKTLLDNKTRTEEYLRDHEDLPPDICFFFTTSRNKEGINISNPDVYWDVYIESHWKEEAMQMWGRIRNGKTQEKDKTRSPINRLVLIDDATQHQTTYAESDWNVMLSTVCKDIVNDTLNRWCVVNGIDRKTCYFTKVGKTIIGDLEKNLPYLRFSIAQNRFRIYEGKLLGQASFTKSVDRFQDYVNYNRGWGPTALSIENIFADFSSIFLVPPDRQEQFEEYAREKGFLNGRKLSQQDRDEMLTFLSDTLMIRQKSKADMKYTILSKALSVFGYKLRECTKHPDDEFYGYCFLEKKGAGEDFLDTI